MKEKKPKTSEGEGSNLQKLDIHGDIYYTTFTRKYKIRQHWKKPNDKEVVSFIPGTIRQVLVKEGETVKAEQKLLVLEAMKMMNTISSPLSGKIKPVKVKVGDRLPRGTVMIEFE
jgi:biotin carboxyl carrier protein